MLQVYHPSTGQGPGITHHLRGAQGRSLVQVGELMRASESTKTPAFPVLLLCYLMAVLSLFLSFPPLPLPSPSLPSPSFPPPFHPPFLSSLLPSCLPSFSYWTVTYLCDVHLKVTNE